MGLASKLAAAQTAAGYLNPGGAATGYGGYPTGPAPYNPANKPTTGGYGQQQTQYGNQYPLQQSPAAQYGNKPVGYGQQSQYGQPGQSNQGQPGQYGQQSQYGQGQGQGQYGQQNKYGQNQYGQQPYGQNQYGQPQQYGAQYGQPQGQYGQQQAQYGGNGGQPGGQNGNFLAFLQRAVQENGLQAFYPPGSVEALASRISGQINTISQQWHLPFEIAVDLVRLALYDIVLYVDDSGSMAFEENGERIEDLKLILSRIASAAALFDNDGIEVRFMNNTIQGNGINSEAAAASLISQIKFAGLTPLGTSLKSKVLEPLAIGPARSGNMKKPVMVITITDGQPAGEDARTVFDVIKLAKQQVSQSRFGPGAIAFQFAQVGNDLGARKFLASLDSDPTVGSMVDCTSNFEVEQDEMAKMGVTLTPDTWVVKLLLGAIDKSYDTQDELRR
ncbi:hypothetical protein V1524DRAFT_425647 [Lipomyces starkeyi]